MTIKTLFRAGLMGLAVTLAATPHLSYAETLRVQGGTIQRALKVPINKAVVIESDVPFAELSIANPQIADISTLSETSIYVLGRAPGRTTLTLLNPEGRLITNVEVQVTADVSELKERLREVLPGEGVEVRPANDGIVLSGTVSSAEAIDAAEAVEADPLSMFEHVYEEQPARLGEQQRELATLRERHGDGAFLRDY